MLLRQVTRGESSGSRGGRSPINLLLLRSAFLLAPSRRPASVANSWQNISAGTAEKIDLQEVFNPKVILIFWRVF
jgi:hypothetical protein